MTDSREPPALTRNGTPRRRRPRARHALVPTPAMLADAPEFAPVPSATNRHDGWTYARQRAFIAGLAETGCVDRAATRIGMTAVGAYRLRKLPGAKAFAAAWAEAQALGVAKLSDIAFDRAINGVPVPIFYKGEQVGERRRYNDRLLMFTLRHHDPERYGGRPNKTVPPHLRRAGFGDEDLTPEQKEARRQASVDRVVRLYKNKVREELRYRREGRLDEAEFTIRQITHIEILLIAGDLQPYTQAIHDEFSHPKWGKPLGDADRERVEEIEEDCRWLRAKVMAEERERLEEAGGK